MVSYAQKHHIRFLNRKGIEQIRIKKNLKGVRNRLVTYYNMKSYLKPSLRKLQRFVCEQKHGRNQYRYSSRYSTLTRILTVYKKLLSRCMMYKVYLSSRKKV